MKLWTYYCGDHRDQTTLDERPSATTHRPVCPVCFAGMYWVPDGGTVVPPDPAGDELPDLSRGLP